ncbi:hypothetical protein RF11_03665 [Thelohanellus kitauei]|uniref:Uncharacterized protein n=1 Tax=Thelohanellus kitauei TaxID=669202 RepID=A0A0C2J3I8_THEKT|nr:hypothetical protein RF11_03665 [Thelohanellus kitauei]
MDDLNNFLISKKDVVRYSKTLEYSNEFDEDPSLGVSVPSLFVASSYNLESDIGTINNGDFWTYVAICVRRPAKYRGMLTEKLLEDHGNMWLKIMKPFMLEKSMLNELYWFTFNAFKLSGPSLDAFFIYNALFPDIGLIFDALKKFHTISEILLTRSYKQICEIKQMYQKRKFKNYSL